MGMTTDDARFELDNWGRWARAWERPAGYGEPAIWNAWLSFKNRTAGWGLTAAEQEAERRGIKQPQGDDWQPPIDEPAAMATDATLRRLRAGHARSYALLRRHFYRTRRVGEDDLNQALLHFCDIALDKQSSRV